MKPKGGRGNVAPYQTCMVRTPIPLKNQVEELIERYREFVNADGDPQNPDRLIDKPVDNLNQNDAKPVDKLSKTKSSKPVLPATKKAPKTKRLSSASAAGLVSIRENALHAARVDPHLSAAASMLVNSIDKAINKPVNNLKPLNLTQLMQRLGQNSRGYAQRIKLQPKFLEWSRSHDPDSIGWQYDAKAKLFYPVN